MEAKTSAPADPVTGTDPDGAAPVRNPAAWPARLRARAAARWLVPLLSLLWLAFELWSAHGSIRDSADYPTRLIHGWYALPGVVKAAFAAGAGAGLLARRRTVATGTRYALGAAGGLAAGGVAALLAGLRYPYAPSIGGIVVVIAVAGLLGGLAAAAVRADRVLLAGLAAMIAALAVTAWLNRPLIGDRMLDLYGKGTTGASEYTAGKLVQYTDFLVCGLAAGIVAALMLARANLRRAVPHGLAGAAAGIMLLIAYALVATGGHALLGAADAIDAPTKLMNQLEWDESAPNAMIVLFVGVLTSLIGYGRSLRKPVAATR